MGYITYQKEKALKVGDTYKKYHQELAEIYVAENLIEPSDANIYDAIFCPDKEPLLLSTVPILAEKLCKNY